MSNFSPYPKAVTLDGTQYNLIAFYYPGHNSFCDNTYGAPCFGNFWPCQVKMTHRGHSATFKTAEAGFQALKWWDKDTDRQAFEACPDGDAAFRLKRKLERAGNHPDYSYAGLAHHHGDGRGGMDFVLAAKFADATLKAALMATDDAYLLEHNDRTGRDARWSDNHDGAGTNWLGHALMKLRADLGGTGNPVPTSSEYKSQQLGGRPQNVNQFTAHV